MISYVASICTCFYLFVKMRLKYSSDRRFYFQNLICFMNNVSLVVLGSVKLSKFE